MTRGVALVLLLLAAACGPERPPPVPPVPPPSDPALRIVLAWTAPVDLDLYVTDPAAESTYFANRESRAGARLVEDFRCEDVPGMTTAREEVVVPEPRAGQYRVGVDFIDACGSGHERVQFRVLATRDGRQREMTGEIDVDVFDAVVMELHVPPGDPRAGGRVREGGMR